MSGALNPFDLEQEVKRVRSLVKTEEGKQALRQELGITFAEDVAKAKNIPIIPVLVPTHDTPKRETHIALERMIAESRDHAILIPQPSISTSILHWSRNDLYVGLLKSGLKYDHVLLMDDDMTPPKDAVIKLLSRNKDIVAAGCTVRQDPPMPNFRVYFESDMNYRTAKSWGKYDGCFEVGAVGTGFMLVRREVFDVVGEYYLSCRHEREFFGMGGEVAEKIEAARRRQAEKTRNQWWFEFLKHPFGEGEFGEDLSFGFKAMRCGIKSYVDTTVRVGHVGTYAYSLNDYCGPVQDERPEFEEEEAVAQ